MQRVRVAAFSISLDGFGAGHGQNEANPLGVGGERLHEWVFDTRTFRAIHGGGEGSTGLDDQFAAKSFENVGAWIMGRNMFGPVRGPWPDESWRGWWGEEPPYHVPVFVLTHHPRPPLDMRGDTTFHFVEGGIEDALERARKAARSKDVRIGGGVSTVRQYLSAGLVDHMHLAVSPTLLGAGENLLAGLDLPKLGYRCTTYRPSERAAHVVIERSP